MTFVTTLPIAPANPAGHSRKSPSMQDTRPRMAHLPLPRRFAIRCQAANSSKSGSSSCKAKWKGKECMAKVVVLLSPTQRTKLLQIPDAFSEREITRYYSLSAEDLAVIEQHRRPQNRLGFTVQLAYLRFPGRPWDPQEQVPPAMLTYLAEQIGEAPDVLADYATRDPTRRDHLSAPQPLFQFHPFTMQAYRDLSRWLMPIALSTDQGVVLMEALIEELRTRHVILPAVSTLERLGWETRRRAQQQVFTTLTQGLSEEQKK